MFRTSVAVALAILSAAPVVAEAPTRAVSYADLDLSSAAGRDTLDRRIGAAIRRVCGSAYPIDLRSTQEVRDCRYETAARVAADRHLGRVYVSQVSGAD